MRVDALIFSKDRACQLDLLLRSIDAHAKFNTVTVVYRATSDEFTAGYRLLQGRKRTFWLTDPDDFDGWLRYWLGHKRTPVCLLVDDCFFYADAPEVTALPWSFRPGEYWYPFTLDGGVYEPLELSRLLTFPFSNPTQLEAGVHARVGENAWPLHHDGGCLVGVPHNIVSASSGMPSMGGTAAELNARFLAGERISLEATATLVDPDGGCHQQIPYVWEQRC